MQHKKINLPRYSVLMSNDGDQLVYDREKNKFIKNEDEYIKFDKWLDEGNTPHFCSMQEAGMRIN